jgi:hypothetical protein
MSDRPENVGSGALIKSDRKEKPSHLNYRGDITILGETYRLAGGSGRASAASTSASSPALTTRSASRRRSPLATRYRSEVVAARWKFWRQNPEPPPCGAEPPQCGGPSPQRGASRFQRAEAALTALEVAWAGAADSPHGDERSPKQLALDFWRALQACRTSADGPLLPVGFAGSILCSAALKGSPTRRLTGFSRNSLRQWCRGSAKTSGKEAGGFALSRCMARANPARSVVELAAGQAEASLRLDDIPALADAPLAHMTGCAN